MTPGTSRSQPHYHEVARPDPSDTRAYLEQVTRAVFRVGLTWKVVEKKWPGFMEVFHDFDPEYVANLSPEQVEAIEENPAVIRNQEQDPGGRRERQRDAGAVAENGTFHDFLASHADPEATVQDLKGRFHHLGETSARGFLWSVGEPTPEWRHQ